jgi:hypothetical protein
MLFKLPPTECSLAVFMVNVNKIIPSVGKNIHIPPITPVFPITKIASVINSDATGREGAMKSK